MTGNRTKRNTRLFLGFLLLAGLTNMIGKFLPTAWDAATTCIHYAIYTGLLIFWLEAVRVRLLPSRARTYMYAAACFMLLYMLLRFFKYSFAVTAAVIRCAVYFYWLPQTMIPALFLMVSIRVRRGEQTPGKWNEALLLIPAGVLSLMTVTNDLHLLVYVPHIPLKEFVVASGSYGYRFGFCLLYVWMLLTVLAGLALLFRDAGRFPRKTVLLFVGDLVLWVGVLLLDLLVHNPHFRFFNIPEANIFGLLGIFEISIRGRLIPHNENYAGFFSHLQMPVLITDRELQPAYASADAIPVEPDGLRSALCAPFCLDPDHKLSGKEINAGYAFWVEDETEIHNAQARLSEANEVLEQENTLLEAETKQKRENAYITARHRIYHEIAEELYPVQRRIGELLADTAPGTEAYRDRIALVSILNAYVKRKTNLLLLAAENDTLSSRELFLALEESAGYLAYQGLQVSVENPQGRPIPAEELIELYDAFERIAEQLIGNAPSLMVSFREDGLRLAAMTALTPDTEEIPLSVRLQESDGILYMDFIAKKGGAAV